MKYYLIIGDNNFWYDSFAAEDQKGIDMAVEDVKRGIDGGEYEHDHRPRELNIYECVTGAPIKVEVPDNICDKCGSHFITHNDDGSCVNDDEL